MESANQRMLARIAVVGLLAVGGILFFIGTFAETIWILIAGNLLFGLGFLVWGLVELTHQSWWRRRESEFLPRWAAILVVIGGIGFLAGAVATAAAELA